MDQLPASAHLALSGDRRRSSFQPAAWGLIAGILVLGGFLRPDPARAVPTSDWLDYAMVAEERLKIGSNLNLSGSFLVTASDGLMIIGQNTYQLDDVPVPYVAAATLQLGPGASVVSAYTAAAPSGSGQIRGPRYTFSTPLPVSLPQFPTAAVCDNCSTSRTDVVVYPSTQRSLSPGCYGELFARSQSTVLLAPGSYTFREWDLQKFSQVVASGPVQVHIRDNLYTEEGVDIFTEGDPDIESFQVWIGSDTTCRSWRNPRQSTIGKYSNIRGTFVAPADDNFNLNKGVIHVGSIYAKEIDVRGDHASRPPTPTPTPSPEPTATATPHRPPTPKPPPATPPRPPRPTPTPPTPTPPTPPTPTPPPPPPPTPTPPNQPTPSPPFSPPTPTPPTPPIPTQPFVPPTPTPPVIWPTPTPGIAPIPAPTAPFIIPPDEPVPTVRPRKHPWGRRWGILDPSFPSRTGPRVVPSMIRPLPKRR